MSIIGDTYTIWYREMLRYKHNVRYVAAQIFFPLVFILVIGFGFNNIVELPTHNLNYVQFLSSGILVFFIAGGALGGGMNLIEERIQGFLKTVIIAPVSRNSIILGKIAARGTLSTIQAVLFIAVISTFANITLEHWWLTLLSIAAMAALFVCLGIVLASFAKDPEKYRAITGFIMFPLYLLSGIFFPVATLPVALQVVARLNPVTYAVDLFRYSITGSHEISLVLDGVLLAVLAAVLFIAAARIFDWKFRD